MTAHEIIHHSDSPEQSQSIAAALAKGLRGGDLVAIEGELGAGKTVFVRGLAEGLGLNPATVSSPTFVICQEYSKIGSGVRTLVHIDAYRMTGAADLESIGWSEIHNDPNLIIALEWPSRINAFLPERRVNVTIEHVNANTRRITIAAPPDMADRVAGVDSTHANQRAASKHADTTKCRRCSTVIDRSTPTFPFCSERCRLSDLGKWFNEGFRVSRAAEVDDELDD